jgi:hypothetical protein
VESVVSGLLRSHGEGREPRTPSFQTTLTPLIYPTSLRGAEGQEVAHDPLSLGTRRVNENENNNDGKMMKRSQKTKPMS